MELRRFQYFIQVAEQGSLSRAAEVLCVAQPALSRQMRLLEEELGVALFVRNSRGMALTEPGEELRARIIGPLRLLKLALQDVRSHSAARLTPITLGLPPTVASLLARPIVERVTQGAPSVTLRIIEGTSAHLAAMLISGAIDMAMLIDQPDDDRIITRDVLIEDVEFVGPPDMPLLGSEFVSFRTVTEYPLILPAKGSSLRDVAERCAAKTKSLLNVVMEIDSLQATKALVEGGTGFTLLPSHVVRREKENGSLASVMVRSPDITRRVRLASRAECRKPRSIMQLDQIVAHELHELVTAGVWRAQLIK